jgi:hypothetical protein
MSQALDVASTSTEDMRLAAGHTYTKAMRSLVLAAKRKVESEHPNCVLPEQTLVDRFRLLVPALENTERVLEIAAARSKRKADCQGQFSSLEMRNLYDWLDERRKDDRIANRYELRLQVRFLYAIFAPDAPTSSTGCGHPEWAWH